MAIRNKITILYAVLAIILIPTFAFVASVAINTQTKTTALAVDDVFALYDESASAGRGIYMSDVAEDMADEIAAAIAEGELANSIVISADIKDATITAGDLAANSVDSSELVNGSVDAGHLAADVIDETKIADNGIDSEHYNDGSIDAAHLAADVIDETKIADDGIDSEHYNDGSIDAAHLAADVIDETKIADDGIDSEHYNDGSVDPGHIALNEGQILVGAATNVAGASSTIPNLAITVFPSTDNTWSGLAYTANAGETIVQWEVVYMDLTDNEWKPADADVSGEWPAWGVATAGCTDGNACVVLFKGCFQSTATTPVFLSIWSDGEYLFLSDVADDTDCSDDECYGYADTATVPATSTDCVQPIARVIDTGSAAYLCVDFTQGWATVP